MVGGEGHKKLDVRKYPKPRGVLDVTWSHLEMRPKYIREYPFEIKIAAVPCSGNSVRGNKMNHAFHLELVTPIWTEAGENGFEFGVWEFNSQTLLEWTPISQLPKTYKVDDKVFKVELGGSHDRCPQC